MKEYPIKDGKDLNALVREFVSDIIGDGLEAELDEELGYSRYDYRNKQTDNSRNGSYEKTLHTSYGDTNIKIPRDRQGEFEPQLVRKHQNTLTQDMEEKIISMYAKGMTTGDMESHVRELYGMELSDSTISRITDKILPVAKEWQQRPLESIYAVIFLDAIHYHVHDEGRIVKKAVYICMGIDMDGRKDILGLWVGENESSKFWLSVINDLKSRGVGDILIACIDGLAGFPEAVVAVYPRTEIQRCIIHQIRNNTKFVSYKDLKALMADLKAVYQAINEETALQNPELSAYFKYTQAVRTLIYTTNAIEGYNRQLRKVTKNKGTFPGDTALFKMLYLATMDITQKWTGKRKDWDEIHNQLSLFFSERLPY